MKKGVASILIHIGFIAVIVVLAGSLMFGLSYMLADDSPQNETLIENITPDALNSSSNDTQISISPEYHAYLDACQVIDTGGTTYSLRSDILVSERIDTCFLVRSSNVVIDLQGYTLDGGALAKYGIYVADVVNVSIRDGTVTSFQDTGVYVSHANYLSVESMNSFGSLNGFYFSDVSHGFFTTLVASDNAAGVFFQDSVNNTVTNITVFENSNTLPSPVLRSGLVVRDSHDNSFHDILAYSNEGSAQNGIYFHNADSNILANVHSYENGFSGVLLGGSIGDGSDFNRLNGSILLSRNQNAGLLIRVSDENDFNGTFCGTSLGVDIACEGGVNNTISGLYGKIATNCLQSNNTIKAEYMNFDFDDSC